MGLTENINLSSLCKLYRGEKENPYNHSEKTGDLDSFTWYKGEKENPYTGDPERPLAAALWIYERDFYLSYLDNADSSTSLEDAYKEWKESFINDYLPGKSPNPYGDRTNWAVVFQTGKR